MFCTLFEWWKDEEIIKSVFDVSRAIHADAIETSVVWAVKPELAREEKLAGLTSSEGWGIKIGSLDLPSRTDQFTSSGIAGSLEGISIDKGNMVLAKSIDKLQKAISDLSLYKKV